MQVPQALIPPYEKCTHYDGARRRQHISDGLCLLFIGNILALPVKPFSRICTDGNGTTLLRKNFHSKQRTKIAD